MNCNEILKLCRVATFFSLAMLLLVVHTTNSLAQELSELKSADTSSPRATLRSFIEACNELHATIQSKGFFDRTNASQLNTGQRILDCIDQSQLPAFARIDRASEVAACLKEILDREELPPWESIPGLDEIENPESKKELTRWRIPGTRITIARVEEGAQKYEFLFSPGTVERATSYYDQIKSAPYRTSGPQITEGFYKWFINSPGHPTVAAIVSKLPTSVQKGRLWGLATWKWPGLLLAFLAALLLMVLVYRLQITSTNRVYGKSTFRYCLTIIFPLLATLIPIGFRQFAEHVLTIRGAPLYLLSFAANLVAVGAGVVLLFSLAKRIAESIIASPSIKSQGLNAQLIRIISRLSALGAAVILFLAGGQYLGIHLTTLLASAGVGGIALALGAQDALKTLFGTISLMADKPFRVGDRIIFEKYDGVVEDIGLRSTKVRLLTGNLATLPNDQLARSDIENVGRRDHIRRIADFHIPLNTPSEKVEKAVQIVRDALKDHEGMDPDFPPRVFFNEIKTSSYNIRMIYWYSPPNYWDYLAFSEKLNLQICQAFESSGIQFTLPQRIAPTTIDGQEQPMRVKVVES